MATRSREEADRNIAWELPFWFAFVLVMGLQAAVGLGWVTSFLVLAAFALLLRLVRRAFDSRPGTARRSR